MTALREKLARAMFAGFVSPSPAAWLTISGGARDHWLAFADSCLATIEESGLVIVPKEATEEMGRAGVEAYIPGDDVEVIWSAMLAAAPKEPTA